MTYLNVALIFSIIFLSSFRSCVAFSGKNRVIGVAAKNQLVSNMKNTIYGFKRLLGRKFKDPFVQQEIKSLPYKVVETSNGNIGIVVNYLDENRTFTPEQITAMLFTKLKEISEGALKTKVNDCVISVSSFWQHYNHVLQIVSSPDLHTNYFLCFIGTLIFHQC